MKIVPVLVLSVTCLLSASMLYAQEAETAPPEQTIEEPSEDTAPVETEEPPATEPGAEAGTEPVGENGDEDAEEVEEIAEEAIAETQQTVEKIAKRVDENEQAKELSAGVLQPIYRLAESLAFPFFYWAAFALMATGVVSYALQLVIGKLVLLTKASFSLKEIISDAVALAISLVGLVLTTQAATENSTFTNSPSAVLSAALFGLIVGFILYRWGQKQEVDAAVGRSRPVKKKSS